LFAPIIAGSTNPSPSKSATTNGSMNSRSPVGVMD
jgi:hypothetical protein